MDSDTYHGDLVARRPDRAGADRPHAIETRYPHAAMPAADGRPRGERYDYAAAAPSGSTGRVRAVLLIVFAVVALSAFAAIGWMQYQANDGLQDPHIEIGSPDRSVPAMADVAGGG